MHLLAGRRVPDAGGPVVADGGEHGAVVVEGDLVDVEVVSGEGTHRLARPCVADVHHARVLGSLGHEDAAVGAPVEGTAHARDAQHGAGGGYRPMQRLMGFGQHRAVVGPGTLDGFEGEERAALGVDVEVGVGGRGELAGLGQAPLVGGAVALADCDDPGDEGGDECERDRDEEGA
jgi:hypothetical protein